MKRFLLFWLFLIASNICWAQEILKYEIAWYMSVGLGGNQGCDTYVTIIAEMENGTEKLMTKSRMKLLTIPQGEFGHSETSGSLIVTADNKVKRFRVYTMKRAANCTIVGQGTAYTPNIDYSAKCPNFQYPGLFAGYSEDAYLAVGVRPLTSKWELKIDMNHMLNRYAYEFEAYATINYEDGPVRYVTLKNRDFTPAYENELSSRTILAEGKRIREIGISYRWKNESNQSFQRDGIVYTIDNQGNAFTRSLGTPYGGISASGGNITVSLSQVFRHVVSGPDLNNTSLPVEQKIFLRTDNPDVRPDVMQWFYSMDDGLTFNPFPDELSWKNPTYFNANDLFRGDAAANYGKKVVVRGLDICGSETYTAPYTLWVSLSSPTFVEAQGVGVSCYGQADGALKLKFSRQLIPGETLGLQVVDVNAGPGGTIENFDVTIGPDGTYTTPADRPFTGGTYKLTLIGGYQGTEIYSGGDAHMATVTVFDPQPLVFSTPVPGAVKCFDGSDGSVVLSAIGGTPGYRLLYKPVGAADFSTADFPGNPITFNNLRKGDYIVSLTDRNNCPAKNAAGASVVTVTVTQPDAPLQMDNLTAIDPLENGKTNGSITVRLKGGSPFADGSYNVSWSKDGQTLTPINTVGNGIYTTALNELGDGVYTLTVKDKNYDAAAPGGNGACIYTEEITLREPPVLEAGIAVSDSISCYGMSDGSLLAVPSGGVKMATAPYYSFRWYKFENGSWQDLNITGIEATGLNTGRYRVLVTDANNVEKYSDPKDFIEPDDLKIQFNETPVSCFGGSNGIATAIVTGGTPPFSYAWSNSATTATAANLITGTYTLNVTDYHQCPVSDLSFIDQPQEALQIVSAPVTTPQGYGYTNGNIKVLLKGGTPMADGTYHITWKSADGTVLSNYTSVVQAGGYETVLNNIGVGDYTLIVTDANYNGADLPADRQTCYIEQLFPVEQPDPIVTEVAVQHAVSCKGDTDGALIIAATGGVKYPAGQAPYQYQWYRIDGSGQVLLPQQTAAIASGLPAGKYKVMVTDMNTVSKESDTFELTAPALLEVALITRAVSCNSGTDGFVKSTVTGGTEPYSWSWTNNRTTQDIINVAAGSYGLLLTDAHACTVYIDTTITEPAMPLSVTDIVQVDPTAFTYTDGSITVILNGGTSDANGLYSIEWTDAQGRQLNTFTQTRTANGVVCRLQNIGDGSYTMKVKDDQYVISTDGSTAGCYVEATYTLHEPPLLTATVREYRYISCINLADGKLAAHVEGGVPFKTGLPYKYQWYRVMNGGETLIPQIDSIITGMPAGNYLVKVTDFNNITRSSQVFTLQQPAKLEIGFTTSAVTCASGMDGRIVSNVTGGTLPYHYEWTNGATTDSIKDLTEGTYMLYVTDARGCVALKQTDIYIPEGIKTTPVLKAPVCYNACDGAITVGVSGGIAPYTYAWNNGSKTKDLTGICEGKYTLTITDAHNCKRIQSFTLEDPAPLTVNIGTDKTLCNGQTWTVNAAIADVNAKYKWSSDNGFSSDKPSVTFNKAGRYNVQVTDAKGCKGADTIVIKQHQVDIAAEFVSPTQAFSDQTISFVNISYPKPEKVEWILPQGATVASKTDALTELKFADTGFYNITLRAHTGDCEQVFTKGITILKGEGLPVPGGAQTPFILDFNVMPNPTDGQFTVQVKLDKQSAIRLRMINIISNQLVSDRKESAATQFNVNYQLNVTAGTYLLLLETPMGNAVRKIVLNK